MIYTIKQASEKTNLKTHSLRYYEKEGLLPRVGRSAHGIRYYTEDDLEWLGLICCLKSTGMTIKQIREFVELSAQGNHTLKQQCELLSRHKHRMEEKILEMRRNLEEVTKKIEYFTKEYEKYIDKDAGADIK